MIFLDMPFEPPEGENGPGERAWSGSPGGNCSVTGQVDAGAELEGMATLLFGHGQNTNTDPARNCSSINANQPGMTNSPAVFRLLSKILTTESL